jgi:hypothetical protein
VQGDETEDLYALLSTVKVISMMRSLSTSQLGPPSNPVSSPRHPRSVRRGNLIQLSESTRGARVSSLRQCQYRCLCSQRSCHRLSLTPLCYLWQRDQGELLSEMIDSGMEAILIKVAGIGLTVKHLGKSLSDMQETLIKLVSTS